MRALITGITGQDGSYLAELLISKGYEVIGLVRPRSGSSLPRISHLLENVMLVEGDLMDQGSLDAAIDIAAPDEVYNLAAQSFVGSSWNQPVMVAEINAVGVVRLLEAVRHHAPKARFYQASTSEMFGTHRLTALDESAPFKPESPYGIAKLCAHEATINYRRSYGLHACAGICFNHESPRRGERFVTRKISLYIAQLITRMGNTGPDPLRLGNIDAVRDWGFAGDYVAAMWAMLQGNTPEEYVIATGIARSVREVLQFAFSYVGLRWDHYVTLDDDLARPCDISYLCGDPSKARDRLKWTPSSTFEDVMRDMIDQDVKAAAHASQKGTSVVHDREGARSRVVSDSQTRSL